MIKRVFDIFLCLPALVLLSPVFIVIAIAIKLSSKVPAIFKRARAGKDGQPFVFYKFRTMKTDADPFWRPALSPIRSKTDKNWQTTSRIFA